MSTRVALVRLSSLVVVAGLALGCRPVVFSGGDALAIVGDAPPPVVEATPEPEMIELREKIQFAKNSDRILAVSHGVLDEVADKIKSAPDIRSIRVEGHASADGNDDHNLDLSSRRAAAVCDYLVGQGVAEDILHSEGFGETRPVADNDTPEGREANRRVEIHIVERAQSGTDATASP